MYIYLRFMSTVLVTPQLVGLSAKDRKLLLLFFFFFFFFFCLLLFVVAFVCVSCLVLFVFCWCFRGIFYKTTHIIRKYYVKDRLFIYYVLQINVQKAD